jgi:hypothetical protein
MTRPKKINSETFKYKVACGGLFITVGYDKDGKPTEVFLNGSKTGGCRSNQESLGRLVSLALRGGQLEGVLDQLTGIICASCSRKKGELVPEERKHYPNSCGDAVARALKKEE